MKSLRLWIFGCSHIVQDALFGAETLADAIKDAEGEGFDLAINLGDVAGKALPVAADGDTWARQIGSMTGHSPSDIYSVAGNHDRGPEGGGESLTWFQAHIDPLGEFPHKSGVHNHQRRWPAEGTVERYKVRIGNVVLLFISDSARPQTPGRVNNSGDPGGVVSASTYQWWKDECALTRCSGGTVITMAHYLPKNTTAATSEFEGGMMIDGQYQPLYHGRGSTAGQYSSFLSFVDEQIGEPFIEWLADHPGDCAIWIGAHTHVKPGKKVGGKGQLVDLHGCLFVQNGALTRFHHSKAKERYSRSQFLTLTHGSPEVKLEAFMHEATDLGPKGYIGEPVVKRLSTNVLLPQP